MCLTVFVVIVLVVALSSIDAVTTSLTSEEVCQQIRTNRLSILLMGSRGHREPSQHRFYLLTERGYLFVVPFANLKVDLQTKRARLIIDTDYKDASQLYNEPSDTFTTKLAKGAYQKFCLLTVDKYEHKFYLMREYGNSSHVCYYFYHLNMGGKYSPVQDCANGGYTYEHFAMNVETDKHFVKNIALFCTPNNDSSTTNKIWKCHTFFSMDFTIQKRLYLDKLVFKVNSTIFTSFYVGVHGHNYTVLLTDCGRVIVGENAFEVSLSDFIDCFPSNQPSTSPPEAIYDSITSITYDSISTSSESPMVSTIEPFPWIKAIGSVAIALCLGGLVAILFYLVIKKRKDKAKRKAVPHKASSPNSSANSPTSNSKLYTSIASITSKISSLFQRSAKSVAKANKKKKVAKGDKAKVAKKKKTSPK